MRSLQDLATHLRRALTPTSLSLLWFAVLSTSLAVAWAWFLSQPFGSPFSRGRLIAYLAMAAIGLTLGVTRVPIHVAALAVMAGLLLGFAWAAAHSSDVFRGSLDFVAAFEWTPSILRLSAALVGAAALARAVVKARHDRFVA